MNTRNNRFKDLSAALKGDQLTEQVAEEQEQDERIEQVDLPSEPQEEPPNKRTVKSEAPQKKKGRASGKRSNPDYDQVGIYIPKTLHLEAKKLLIDQPDQDFSDLMTKLLEKWVKSKSKSVE